MMVLLLVVAFFVALISVWVWLTTRMRKNGRGAVVRHLAGSSAGSLAGMLAFSVIAVIFADYAPKAPVEPKVAMLGQPLLEATVPEYTLVSDEYMDSIKRTVEISLPARISPAGLKALAADIKAKSTRTTDRTFIGYRIAGEPKASYWATTHYNPELEVQILGMSAELHKKFEVYDVAAKYPNAVGAWISDVSFPNLLVMYRKSGKLYLDVVFDDGINTQTLKIIGRKGTQPKLQDDQGEEGEFYTVSVTGELQYWNDAGENYLTLKPRRAGDIDLNSLK